jgi:hypothetical protein
MNEYDSGKMRDVLEAAHGMTRTDNPAEADVLLVNTCSVREKAQEKVFSLLGEWRLFKQQRPHVVIGVGGCVASQEGEGITARAPFVDLVFGPQTLHRLPAMLDGLKQSGRSQIDVSFPEIEKFDRLPEPRADRRHGLRLHHGRLQQVLHLLRRALHARRGDQPAVRAGAEREVGDWRARRARDHAARPERQRLRRDRWRMARSRILATLIHFVAAIRAWSAFASRPRIRSTSTTA